MRSLLVVASVLFFTISFAGQTTPPAWAGTAATSNFAALSMDGTKIDTAEFRGKVVVLNLWFINCPNCVQEITALNQLVSEYSNNKDVVFLGLAASRKADLQKFLLKNPFSYTVIPDATGIILSKFGTTDKKDEFSVPFPMHYVLDRDGKVLVKAQGTKGIAAVRSELSNQFKAGAASSK
jgi:peroxiredoxin